MKRCDSVPDGPPDLGFRTDAAHHMVPDPHRPFIVFNDDGRLSLEPVGVEDLTPIVASGPLMSFYASAAWSSDVPWIFVVTPTGVALLDQQGRGYHCRRRSADFFRFFLEMRDPRSNGPGGTLVGRQAPE